MSMEALNWAWGVACTPTQKLVLLCLADRADEEGVCWPSVNQTSIRCSLSRRAAQNAIKALSRAGVIAWHDFKDGRNTTRHKFTLNLRTSFAREPDSPVNDVHATREPVSPPPANDVHPPCEPDSRTPCTTFAQTHREPTRNPKLEPKGESTHPPSPPQGGSAGAEEIAMRRSVFFEEVRIAAGRGIADSTLELWAIAIHREWDARLHSGKPVTFASRVLTELTAIGADLSVGPKAITVPGKLNNSGKLFWKTCAFDFISQQLGLGSKARRLAISWEASLHARANLSTHDTWQDDLSAFVKNKGHAERSE